MENKQFNITEGNFIGIIIVIIFVIIIGIVVRQEKKEGTLKYTKEYGLKDSSKYIKIIDSNRTRGYITTTTIDVMSPIQVIDIENSDLRIKNEKLKAELDIKDSILVEVENELSFRQKTSIYIRTTIR